MLSASLPRMVSSGSCYSPFDESPLTPLSSSRAGPVAVSHSLPTTYYSNEGYPFPWMPSRPSTPLVASEKSAFSSSSEEESNNDSSPPSSASSSPSAAAQCADIATQSRNPTASSLSLLRPTPSPLTKHPLPSPFCLQQQYSPATVPLSRPMTPRTPADIVHSRVKNAGSTPSAPPLGFVPSNSKGKAKARGTASPGSENEWEASIFKREALKVSPPPSARIKRLPMQAGAGVRNPLNGGFAGMSAMKEAKKDEGSGVVSS